MTEFRFAYPLALAILLLPVATYRVPALERFRPHPGKMLFSDIRLMNGLVIGWRVRLRVVPDALRLLAWIVLVIVLARPQTGSAQEIVRGQGVDIVIALDISTTMGAPDFAPFSRLEAAKEVVAEFVARRDFDRIGLIAFAQNAFHLAPPTRDYPILLGLLDRAALVSDLESAASQRMDRTAIGMGIASSANMLRSSTATSKVIILLTDGDNNAGIDPSRAAEAAAALGIRIYTIGMGLPGQGDLNEDLMREVATIGRGLYFRAEDIEGLQQIYRRIDMLERSDAEKLIFVRWQDRSRWLMVIVLVLLVVERILRRTVFQTIP
jgi:Ca-activated chloride channel family protein